MRHVVARKGEGMVTRLQPCYRRKSRMTQGWHATTVPPCCPSCHHMIRPSLIRDHCNFGTIESLPYKQRGFYRHSYATHKLSREHVKHLSYQMFKTRLPGSEKSESSSAKLAALSPLPEPTANHETGTNVKTNTYIETLPNIFQINPIKN